MKQLFVLFAALNAISAFAASPFWISGGNGFRGANPVLAGYEDGHALYVCRIGSGNFTIPGKLHSFIGKCYIGYYGLEYEAVSYEVLQDPDSRSYWANRDIVPANKVIYGGNEYGNTLNICRVSNAIPGKLFGGLGGACFYGMHGSEKSSRFFEVLAER